jgi:hypothetical protein
MSIRSLLWILFAVFVCDECKATIQDDINAACSTGGTVNLPPSLTVTTTINLTCDPPASPTTMPHIPVLLKGAPTLITCQTGASPCIAIGAKTPGFKVFRENLALSDVYLSGPGRRVTGSVGIRLLNSAAFSRLDHVRIDWFERGLHVSAPDYLLNTAHINDVKIGVPNGSTLTAIHIEGIAANIKFVNFGLGAWERILLMDGPGGTGGGASFTSGFFNSTATPGIPAIAVSNSDGSIKQLNISNVEDWETRCPFIELGAGAWVTLSTIGWWQDPSPTVDNQHAIHILPDVVAWLKMSDVALGKCTGTGMMIKNESARTMIWAAASDLAGKVDFTVGGGGSFVGNRCDPKDGSPSIFTGVTTNIRSQGNRGSCPAL